MGNRNAESGPQPQGNINLSHRSTGKTALHWAAAVNNARAARSLLQAGADKDAQDGRVRPGRGIPTKKKKQCQRSEKRRNPAKA